MVYNTERGAITGVPLPDSIDSGDYQWSGAAVVRSTVYGIPLSSTHLLVYDTERGAITGVRVPAAVVNQAFGPLPPVPPAGFGAAGPVYELPDSWQPAIYDENKRGPAAVPVDYDQVARAVGAARAASSEHLCGEPVTVRSEGPYSTYDASGRADECEPTEQRRPAPQPKYATVVSGAAPYAGIGKLGGLNSGI